YRSMKSATVLMVAEKPLLADSIAKILSNNTASKRKGRNGVCSVSEYGGQFLGKPAFFKVTSTCGHVMSLDFPPRFNNWERIDPVELYSAPTTKIEANPKMHMNDYLSFEAKGADYLVLWLDCDKEGENICFEVIDAVRDAMKRPQYGNFMDNVYRARFSAITEKDIKYAMQNLARPNQNEARAVDARQELDLRVGCSFTRFQTKFFQNKYGDLDSTVISYGPCQTPTLGFCVTRHDQITHFKPESYWVLQCKFDTPDGTTIRPEWKRGRLFDRDVCQLFLDRVKKAGTGIVTDRTTKESRKERPIALNTVELMRVASSSFGISPASTMSVAEQLYTQGYISYPRTETTAYPPNFDLVGTLKQQSNNPKWGDIVKKVLNDGIRKPKGGEDKGDHPPITPMKPSNGQLSGDMARIYDYVVQHFVATLMGPCIYDVTTVTISCGDEIFQLTGKTVKDPGFTEVMTWLNVDDDQKVPSLNAGDQVTLKESSLYAGETSPPGYLTESELITLMEKHGIGTDASIPVHINTISQRNYVTVESGRRLVPTQLGISLVHGYWRVDRELVLPTMRAEVETQLNLIAQGKADYHAVRDHALEMFLQKFIYYVKNIGQVDTLFEASFTSLSDSGKPFCRCGKCRRYMKLVATRPQRLFCPTCQETYSVPNFKDGVLRPYGEKKCPLDEFELVYWHGPGGKLARSFAFCPFCYNNPPFESMKESEGCLNCPHPACPHSYMTSGVCGCLQECGGVMVLDPQSHPKWRLTCNRCPSVVAMFDGALKFRVTESSCPDCEARIVIAEYKDKSPLPDDKTTFKGCMFCDESVKNLVNLHHAFRSEDDRIRQDSRRGGRGRGRGRGRGAARGVARGSGRGAKKPRV
uniref:DNA topoisomerase n=1 Tax=Haemonchus contortus TaxID=6289 RepID=A0A7I4Y7E0_HAECO